MQETKDVLIKKTIKIDWAETKAMSNGKYMTKLKDSDGNKYTLFHTKKDGTDSKAFQSFKLFPMSGINSFVEVVYKVESFEKDGTQYTSNKVLGLTMEKQPEVDIPQMKLESDVDHFNPESETKTDSLPF